MTLFGNWLGGRISKDIIGAEVERGRGRTGDKIAMELGQAWGGWGYCSWFRDIYRKKRQVVAESGRVYSLGYIGACRM